MTKSGAERLLDAERWGFWTRTKQAPFRAVIWDAPPREDGKRSFHGKGWVEVLAYGEDREPKWFYTADVEAAGPHEWLEYYPDPTSPVCGWGRPRLPEGGIQYCPRKREEGQPFCQRHIHELLDDTEERNLSGEDQSDTGGEPVSAAE